jgi:hypothetical protein
LYSKRTSGRAPVNRKCLENVPKMYPKCGRNVPQTYPKCGRSVPETYPDRQNRSEKGHQIGRFVPHLTPDVLRPFQLGVGNPHSRRRLSSAGGPDWARVGCRGIAARSRCPPVKILPTSATAWRPSPQRLEAQPFPQLRHRGEPVRRRNPPDLTSLIGGAANLPPRGACALPGCEKLPTARRVVNLAATGLEPVTLGL